MVKSLIPWTGFSDDEICPDHELWRKYIILTILLYCMNDINKYVWFGTVEKQKRLHEHGIKIQNMVYLKDRSVVVNVWKNQQLNWSLY